VSSDLEISSDVLFCIVVCKSISSDLWIVPEWKDPASIALGDGRRNILVVQMWLFAEVLAFRPFSRSDVIRPCQASVNQFTGAIGMQSYHRPVFSSTVVKSSVRTVSRKKVYACSELPFVLLETTLDGTMPFFAELSLGRKPTLISIVLVGSVHVQNICLTFSYVGDQAQRLLITLEISEL
jgi:hypothetical protein